MELRSRRAVRHIFVLSSAGSRGKSVNCVGESAGIVRGDGLK